MKKNVLISFAVFIAGLCSIVYELLISTAATYFLGDSVKQFSITIGIYLFSMGIGAFFAQYNQNKPLRFFIIIEFLLAILGGLSIPLIYYLFVELDAAQTQWCIWGLIFLIGLLTGTEVPLLTFALKNIEFKEGLSQVLSLDYFGGLIATLVFPFVLLPFVGLFHSSLLFGFINLCLGLVVIYLVKDKWRNYFLFAAIGIVAIIGLLFIKSDELLSNWDNRIYRAPIAEKIQTPYQLIVLTKKQEDIRLYLNRVIQFSSRDEHRYHESLVHTPLGVHREARRVLILGGGENLAAREVLKHSSIISVDVVDLDSMIFHLAKTNEDLIGINKNAAIDPRVNLIADDAFNFLSNTKNSYDIIISDLPDPNSEATAKLYTRQFFSLAKSCLKEDGIFITQAGEIYMANTAFNCIKTTVNEVYEEVYPLHCYIPSFGDWGFVMASDHKLDFSKVKGALPDSLLYLSEKNMLASFDFPKDIPDYETKVNHLDNPIILKYFIDDWEYWKSELRMK